MEKSDPVNPPWNCEWWQGQPSVTLTHISGSIPTGGKVFHLALHFFQGDEAWLGSLSTPRISPSKFYTERGANKPTPVRFTDQPSVLGSKISLIQTQTKMEINPFRE